MMFKKTKSAKTTSANGTNSTSFITPAIEAVLSEHEVAGKRLSTLITDVKRHGLTGNTLTLTISLPTDVAYDEINNNMEALHARLGQTLHPHGIQELNLDVHLVSASSKPPKQANTSQIANTANKTEKMQNNLPKVSNAMQHVNAPTQSSTHSNHSARPTAKTPLKQSQLAPHPRIEHIVVIASGKGGVGKSTTTVNLALALQQFGHRVGVLDADIYGPSIPTMLGVAGIKPLLENEQFVPIDAHGLAMLSIGSLLDGDNTPVAWRGPKATGALMQLFSQTNWPKLDYLLIDMPPGTGDIQLTLAQRIPVTGAVIVTTPQHIALLDAKKGIEMFAKTQIPVLGIVENMAVHTCSNCGHSDAIFGQGGGEQMSQNYGVPLLGQLPLASGIRTQVDAGVPSVIANNNQGDDFASFYRNIAKNIDANIIKYAKTRNDGRIF